MKTLEEIRAELQDRRIDKVAKACSLYYDTVLDIRDGTTQNPSYRTMKALSDYLEGGKPDLDTEKAR